MRLYVFTRLGFICCSCIVELNFYLLSQVFFFFFSFFFFLNSQPTSCLNWQDLGQIGFCGGLVTKSCPTLPTLRTVACQAPLSVGFSRQEYWSGLPFPSPGHVPDARDQDCRHILYQLSQEGSPDAYFKSQYCRILGFFSGY